MTKSRTENDLKSAFKGRALLAVFPGDVGAPLHLGSDIEVVRGLWGHEHAFALVGADAALAMRDTYEADLKAMHDIFLELSVCEDLCTLCRRAVLFGKDRLGFERLGLWLVDQGDARWKRGTWGIDEHGQLRDESGSRIPVVNERVPVGFYESRSPVFSSLDSPCFDAAAHPIGRGHTLIAPLWDGRGLIGELCVDNLLSGLPYPEEKSEVLVLYARMLAHLVCLKRAELELRLLASTDSLTGTVNRRTALIILEKLIAQSHRSGAPLAICLADLDGLKIVNDAHGHAAGDDYIRAASAALVGAVRSGDTVGRIGGDEFIIVFPECKGEVVATILEKVNADLGRHRAKQSFAPHLSWGMASLAELTKGEGGEAVDTQRCIDLLLELADQRMYENKRRRGVARGVHKRV